MKRIQVVAAVIFRFDKTLAQSENNHILIARRADHLHQGGLWEFPGGKVEKGETHHQSLVRELQEEINITITSASPMMQISHDYIDKSVTLDIWKVIEFEGNPEGAEGQEIRWVSMDELRDYDFPAANQPILQKLLGEH
ncbi:MAG: 8-oxo-dGTP diphosphatase [Polaribacter sp.]|jgi:8-oxo-dGTP diphosphatase|tara:strand:+ start:4995 stop:5411 length:417 start_codon:yes stop_codon:yes gene_type:complete